ncbi:MAG: hypothetical protein RL420_679, partial [Pseudomonadota bacterium]
CPAKQVNRHGGGAALLQDPEVLYRITRAVRAAVPAHQIVSAKMRLGFDHDQQAEECALALEAGGAGEIVIHARTKADGYRPPAYWPRIADIRARGLLAAYCGYSCACQSAAHRQWRNLECARCCACTTRFWLP